MTQLSNTFEGGTAGTTLTGGTGGNTGGASGDFFNQVNASAADSIIVFDTDSHIGSLSCKMATRATAGSLDLIWTATSRGSIADDYIRFYFKTDDIVTGGIAKQLVRWFSGGSSLGGILFGNGRLYVTDETNTALTANSTTLLPANQWVRIEAHIHPRTDGTGSIEIKLWLSPDSNGTPDWDFTISGRTYPAAVTDQIIFGSAGPGANWPTATGFIRLDGIVTGASTWVGPVPPKSISPNGITANSTIGASITPIRGGGGGSGTTSIYGVGVYGLASYGAPLAGTVYKIAATSTVRGQIGRIQSTPTPTPIPYKPPQPPPEVFAEIGTFAQAVYNLLNLDSILSDDLSRDRMLQFIGAIGAAFQQMDDLAHADPATDDPPWSKLLDVDRIPDEGLAWFGQFTGVVLNPNLDANGQRQQIRDRAGWKRGTVPVIAAAIQQFLTGTQTVAFIERDTSPYHFNVATYSDETNAFAQSIIPTIIKQNKPAGLQFTYTLIAGSPATSDSYENLFIDENTYAAVYSDDQSYEEVYINP